MGTSASQAINNDKSSQYGQIVLQTESQSYSAGTTLAGSVNLNIKQNLDKASLMLKFKGFERVYYVETTKREPIDKKDYKNPIYIDNLLKQKNKIIDICLPV